MKNNKVLKIMPILLVCACFAVHGRGGGEDNGERVSRERPVGEFTGIALNGAAKVNVHFSGNHRVVVSAGANIQDRVTTVVENNLLDIDLKGEKNESGSRITVDVYLPRMDTIILNGVGSINVDEGSGPDLTIRQKGVGSMELEKYRLENADITHSGVGTINIWVENSLNGDFSGVGSIRYKGNPRMNMDVHGVGGVERIR